MYICTYVLYTYIHMYVCIYIIHIVINKVATNVPQITYVAVTIPISMYTENNTISAIHTPSATVRIRKSIAKSDYMHEDQLCSMRSTLQYEVNNYCAANS